MNLTKQIQKTISVDLLIKKNHPIVLENILYYAYEADVFSINKNGFSSEFEVKVSRNDFKNELKNKLMKHKTLNSQNLGSNPTSNFPNYFSFVTPVGLLTDEDLKQFDPRYGWIEVENNQIIIKQKAKKLHKKKLNIDVKEKIFSNISERLVLGCAKLTYQNNKLKEQQYKKFNEWIELTDSQQEKFIELRNDGIDEQVAIRQVIENGS